VQLLPSRRRLPPRSLPLRTLLGIKSENVLDLSIPLWENILGTLGVIRATVSWFLFVGNFEMVLVTAEVGQCTCFVSYLMDREILLEIFNEALRASGDLDECSTHEFFNNFGCSKSAKSAVISRNDSHETFQISNFTKCHKILMEMPKKYFPLGVPNIRSLVSRPIHLFLSSGEKDLTIIVAPPRLVLAPEVYGASLYTYRKGMFYRQRNSSADSTSRPDTLLCRRGSGHRLFCL
jgi:hypothetical protein